MPEPDTQPAKKTGLIEPGMMDTALLHTLTGSREQLARSIARNNLELRSEQITTAINRILFPLLLLRIAKDRGLLSPGSLDDIRHFRTIPQLTSALAPYADSLYPDESPNAPRPAGAGQDLVIDDRVIRGVVEAVLSMGGICDCGKMQTGEIAQVLMQYLTRTVRRSATHQAIVADTHETVVSGRTVIAPRSLVNYMAKQALASARKNRSSREILPLRVFDPACGSGTVLIAVFCNLLEHAGGPSLTFEERREILMHSVHGLDVNRHAVAVTRMLLFLELCNRPGTFWEAGDFSGAAQSVIRDLRHTVICGNALIGLEIVRDESWMFCPVRDRHTLNPFSYRDRFPEIVAGGGFDLIVSNPPEGALEQREWLQQYFQRRYSSYHPLVDRSAYFIEKSLLLVSPGGIVSSILSNRWLRGSGGSPLRSLLAARRIDEIIDLSYAPFDNPGAGLCLLRIRAAQPARNFHVLLAGAGFLEDPETFAEAHRFPVDHELLDEGGWVLRDNRVESVIRNIGRHGTPLGESVMGQVCAGIKIPEDDPLVIDENVAREWLRRDPRCRPLLFRLVTGAEVRRYSAGITGKFYLLIPQGWTASHMKGAKNPWQVLKHRYPHIARYLKPFEEILTARAGPESLWWEKSCDDFWREPKKKILFPAQFSNPSFLYDTGRAVGDETMLAIPSAGLYLAGILNSRLIAFAFDHAIRKAAPDRQVFSWDDLRNLPVYTPDFDRTQDRARHDRMEKLVRRRIDLEKSCRAAKSDPEHEDALVKKIHATDRQIDTLVYDLYGLTANEIAVIEETVAQ
jgi:adenine-specific DNA-methyltransferase